MSNLRSVTKAFERLGASVRVAHTPAEAEGADGVVLPGVGHFGEAMRRIRAQGLDAAVRDAVDAGTPVLGLCVGIQLLFESSEEAPGVEGLGLLPGTVRRLQTDRKVPQIGWNRVTWAPGCPVAPDEGDPLLSTYYFVHTYRCVPDDPEHVLGTAVYGEEFCAAAGRPGLMGLQFHPEKSSRAGLELLGRWLARVPTAAAA
jgi:imidazole glycerol-phosphate synthase subunit HisH